MIELVDNIMDLMIFILPPILWTDVINKYFKVQRTPSAVIVVLIHFFVIGAAIATAFVSYEIPIDIFGKYFELKNIVNVGLCVYLIVPSLILLWHFVKKLNRIPN